MKKIKLFIFFLTITNIMVAQSIMVIHQGNGSKLNLPLASIDSVKYSFTPPVVMQKIYQNNGNILGIAVSDIDSITYILPANNQLPVIGTAAVNTITSTSVVCGGLISADGGSTITARGVCWSRSPNPTLANNFTVDGTGIGNYGSSLFPLDPSTNYYARAYATNANGTAYGNQISFMTAAPNGNGNIPTITTTPLNYSDLSLNVTSGGNITADGGLVVTARGVCWAVGATPTINNDHTIDGSGAGNFTSQLTNVLPGITYFVRAYATNDAGTGYGITYSFKINFPDFYFDTTGVTGCSFGYSCRSNSDGTNKITIAIDTVPGLNSGIIVKQFILKKGITYFDNYFPKQFSRKQKIYLTATLENAVGKIVKKLNFFLDSIFIQKGNGLVYYGKNYSSFKLGNGQEWLGENLSTSFYSNGDPISNEPDSNNFANRLDGVFTSYNNDTSNDQTFGKYYNFYVVTDSRGVCPPGWHVPKITELNDLGCYMGLYPDDYKRHQVFYPLAGELDSGYFSKKQNAGFWWYGEQISGKQYTFNIIDDGITKSVNGSESKPNRGVSIRCIKN